MTYPQLARLLACSVPLIKATLDETLKTLGIHDRTTLLRSHRPLLYFVPDKLYTEQYGISKIWWFAAFDGVTYHHARLDSQDQARSGQSHKPDEIGPLPRQDR